MTRCYVLILAVFATAIQAILHHVTITGREEITRRIQGASAFVLEVGNVSTDVSWEAFAIDPVVDDRSILLHVFEHYRLPKAKFNGRVFCCKIHCLLKGSKGQVVYEIMGSCENNDNPSVCGPIMATPDVTSVNCTLYWEYPGDKGSLADSVKVFFVSAYQGFCEAAPRPISNSSDWCNVNLKRLVDANYDDIELDLCMEKAVALEIFNATCSGEIPAWWHLVDWSQQAFPIGLGATILLFVSVACVGVLIKRRTSRSKRPERPSSPVEGRGFMGAIPSTSTARPDQISLLRHTNLRKKTKCVH